MYGGARGSIASGVQPVSLVVTPAYRRKLGHPSGLDDAEQQADEGDQESPIQEERDEQHPGDWTEGSRN